MSRKLYSLVKNRLDKKDKIRRVYQGVLDENSGYLILSNKKIMFVEVAGFLKKRHNLILDLPYGEMYDISQTNKYELNFSDLKGKKHVFQNLYFHASRIEENLELFMNLTKTKQVSNSCAHLSGQRTKGELFG